MNNCRHIKRMLSRYLDKETTRSDNARIKGHLDHCSSCQTALSELSCVKGLVSGKGRMTLPPDYLVIRLRDKISEAVTVERQRFPLIMGMGALSRRLIPVPVTVIVLSLFFLISNPARQATGYALDDHLFSGNQTTTSMAFEFILGIQH